MATEVKVYSCPECEELVPDGDTCHEPRIFTGYQCEICCYLSDNEEEANNCCDHTK